MAMAYCVKDKMKVEVQNPQQITMKNGKKALSGTCPKCGTKVFKIGVEPLLTSHLGPPPGDRRGSWFSGRNGPVPSVRTAMRIGGPLGPESLGCYTHSSYAPLKAE